MFVLNTVAYLLHQRLLEPLPTGPPQRTGGNYLQEWKA